ncbi:heavy metal translocating P-type ATPase [Planctomycetota bacterium]
MDAKKQTSSSKITLPVEGMHCAACALNIERSIGHLPGVLEASVNFAKEDVTVHFDSFRVTLNQIEKAITRPGYRIRESTWQKTRGFWQIHGLFIRMVLTALLIINSWVLIQSYPVLANFLALAAVVIGGYSIFLGAIRILLVWDLNVEVLITIASIAAIGVQAYREAAMVVLIVLVGETLENSAIRKTRSAIAKLMELTPLTALVRRNNKEAEIPIEEVHIKDTIIIKPGARIPVDGVVIKGEGDLDQSILTGESLPIHKQVGDRVYSGTINEAGSFEIQTQQIGEGTQLDHIKRLVMEAETQKAPVQRMADKIARYFIPVVMVIAVVILLSSGNIYKTITVLVAACPCALVLAAPTAVVAGLGNAARKGILIKGGQYLETLGQLDTLLLDKTGTLTQAKISVTDIKSTGQYSEEMLLQFAAIAENKSEHPLARAILARAQELKLNIPESDFFESIRGMGVNVKVRDQMISLGNYKLFHQQNIDIPVTAKPIIDELEKTGKTVLLVAVNKKLEGMIAMADVLRPGVKDIINDIRNKGIRRIVMLTGDNERAAGHMAQQAGITEWHSRLLPEDKIKKLNELKQAGARVAMIGDGVNDAPALAAADVGIAMGTIGSDVAIEAADISLAADDLSKVSQALHLSRNVRRIIMQSFVFAVFYNVAMMVLIALFVQQHSGITLGAIAHQLSSFVVIGNSLRLLRG